MYESVSQTPQQVDMMTPAMLPSKSKDTYHTSYSKTTEEEDEHRIETDSTDTDTGSTTPSQSASERSSDRDATVPVEEEVVFRRTGSPKLKVPPPALSSVYLDRPRTLTTEFKGEEEWYTPTDVERQAVIRLPSRAQEEALARSAPSSQEVVPVLPPKQDYWGFAETSTLSDMENPITISRVLHVEYTSHAWTAQRSETRPVPWKKGESHDLYKKCGAQKPSGAYVAWWLNLGRNSLLSVSEVVDMQKLEQCIAGNGLSKRIKLLIKPVECALPFPAKSPKAADTVGDFFGAGASLTRDRTAEGTEIVVVQVDLFYLRMLRFALNNVGLRKGNVVDLVLIDWQGKAVLASFRLCCTESFCKLREAKD